LIHFQAKKLYNNKVSVRSCIVLKADKKKEAIEVTVIGLEGRMRINAKTPYTTDGIEHIAQYDDKFIKKDKKYQLFDYEWLPIEEHKEEQTESGLQVMLKAWKNRKLGNQLSIPKSI